MSTSCIDEADRSVEYADGRTGTDELDAGVSCNALSLRRAAPVEGGRNDDTDCKISCPELVPAQLVSKEGEDW